jgi:hypothetical protein
MIVKTRKTISGTEYWDTKNKKMLVVPHGQEPPFEVVDNPKSMIYGVDLAKGKDETVITRENGDGTNLEDMTIPQLKDFAKQIDVDIPSDIKKKDDIIKYLSDNR